MAYYEMMPAGLPAGLQSGMDSVLNKKFGTATSYAPGTWPDTVNLMGPLPEKTIVSSPIADFSDGADDVPTKSLVVTIAPTLSGKSEVVCTSAHNGNFYNLANGRQLNLALPKGTTIYCKTESPSSYIKIYMRVKGASTSTVIFDIVASMGVRSYTLPDDIEYLTMTESNYNTLVNGGYKIMISLESDGDYTPYQTPTTYTASLGRTIYGGTADIVNGEGVEWANYDMGSINWYKDTNRSGVFYSGAIPSRVSGSDVLGCLDYEVKNIAVSTSYDNYISGVNSYGGNAIFIRDTSKASLSSDEFKTAMSGKRVWYMVNNLSTFTFDGQEINTRLGYNAFWSDEGDTEVTYRADINLALQALSGSRGLMMARPQLEPETEPEETIEETPEEMER